MAEITKQALKVDNSQSFPNNNNGTITPSDLRDFNVNLIDSLVDEIGYNVDSGSWNRSINALNTFTSSQQPTFTALNSFTASQLNINSGVNLFTQSADGRLDVLENDTANLEAFTSSINDIIVNGAVIGKSTRFFFNGFVSASIVPNVGGPIASITVLTDTTYTPSASFNAYTASTNAYTASAKVSVTQLNSTTASLNTSVSNLNTFSSSTINSLSALNAYTASDAISQNELNVFSASAKISIDNLNSTTASLLTYVSSSTIELANIEAFTASILDTNAFTSSAKISITNLNAYTQSNDSKWNSIGLLTGSYATTGSNTFVQPQTISGSLTITGSAYGNVFSASIVSNTASIDLNVSNFFQLTLPNGVNTNINILNPKPGTTAIIEITNIGIPSASFSSNVKQQRFNTYLPTSGSATADLLSVISLTTSSVYVANSLNFV